jgi:rare lipoprotein A (peptidoglycan hydrolase)
MIVASRAKVRKRELFGLCIRSLIISSLKALVLYNIIRMKKFLGIFVFLLASALVSNTNSKAGTNYWPPIFIFSNKTSNINTSTTANIITGLATYYARKFEGNLTATGEVFHHCDLTAASNFFALNTWVKVTNLLSGKSIVVRINDRMHPDMSKKGRVLDLTMTGAKQLKIVNRGVAKVKIEPLSTEETTN